MIVDDYSSMLKPIGMPANIFQTIDARPKSKDRLDNSQSGGLTLP